MSKLKQLCGDVSITMDSKCPSSCCIKTDVDLEFDIDGDGDPDVIVAMHNGVVKVTTAKPKIIHLDDNNVNQALMKQILKVYDIDLVECSLGGEVISYIEKEEQPSIFIIDLGLPDMEGTDVIREIKKKDKNAVIYVITANATLGKRKECERLGITEYLTKPVSVKYIRNLVKEELDL